MGKFHNIYYDNYNNVIHLWENENGSIIYKKINHIIEYYIVDKNSNSNVFDIWGNPVIPCTSHTKKDMYNFLSLNNVTSCETNLDENIKYLQKKYKDENLTVNINDFQISTIDIELESGDEFKQDVVETIPYPINLITVYYSKTDEIITYGLKEYTGNKIQNYYTFPNERELLLKFIIDFRQRHVDILTGWNIEFFDIPYIINRCKKLDIKLSLSPINKYKPLEVKDRYGNKRNTYSICGISILDGLKSYLKFTYKKQINNKLNTIGLIELNVGKMELDGKINHIYKTNWNQFVEYNVQDVILTRDIERKMKFIELIINFSYQALIPFEHVYSTISLVTGYFVRFLHKKNIVCPDSKKTKKELFPGAYVYANSGLYNYLISFDVESEYPHMIMMYNISPETLVLNPKDTTNLIKTPASDNYKCNTKSGEFNISGIYYRSDKKGILPEIIEKIFNGRKYNRQKSRIASYIEKNYSESQIVDVLKLPKEYVKELIDEIKQEGFSSDYYNSQQLILKILINSMYGVLGNPNFLFYNIYNAMAITIGGRHLIKFLSDTINNYMKTAWHKTAKIFFPKYITNDIKPIKNDVVVLIDTDSNYICLDEIIKNMGLNFDSENKKFHTFAIRMDNVFFRPFFNKILNIYVKQFNVKQLINFKREKIILKKIILAKKKYVDLVIDDEGTTSYSDGVLYTNKPKLSITGIETVKTTTPKFCKNIINDIIVDIMINNNYDNITNKLSKIYNDFCNASIDDISKNVSVRNYSKYNFDIKKYINNSMIEYPLHCPQHVKAAINFNYIVTKYKLNLELIGDGTDIKMIYIHNNNIFDMDIIGYIGNYPDFFKSLFKIDYDLQWDKNFKKILSRIYAVINWGDVNVNTIYNDNFINFS